MWRRDGMDLQLLMATRWILNDEHIQPKEPRLISSPTFMINSSASVDVDMTLLEQNPLSVPVQKSTLGLPMFQSGCLSIPTYPQQNNSYHLYHIFRVSLGTLNLGLGRGGKDRVQATPTMHVPTIFPLCTRFGWPRV